MRLVMMAAKSSGAKTLSAFLTILAALVANPNCQDCRSAVNANIVLPSQVAANTSLANSLNAGLTERASTNQRYLSAASTASLAAAQVAAGQNGGSQSTQQSPQTNLFVASQQQQQQQQQSVSASNNLNQIQNNNNNLPQQQPQQPANQPTPSQIMQIPTQSSQQTQQQQQPSLQQQSQLTNTPLMTTTYTYNPQSGGYAPAEFTTGNIFTPPNVNYPTAASFVPQVGILSAPLGGYLGNNGAVGGYLDRPFNPFGSSSSTSNRPVHPFFTPDQQLYGQGLTPLRQQQQQYSFNRRNGLQSQQQPQITSSRFNQFGSGGGGNVGLGGDDDPFASGLGGLGAGNVPPQPLTDFDFQLNQLNPLSSLNSLQSQVTQQQQQQQQIFNDHLIAQSQPGGSGGLLSTLQPPFVSSVSPTPATSSGGLQSAPDYKSSTEQCFAADNRRGTCYQASECIRRGGTPMGKCGGTTDYSGSSSVCCLFDVTCGQFAAERFVYFRNPGYPQTHDSPRMCRARIGKLDKGVCQLRLDMLRFDIARPINGNCSTDVFVVSGQNENYVMPKICGLNDGQHYHVGVDESGVITLHMMMMGYSYRRSFEILVTQIPCKSDYAAPAHCLQYYVGTHGTLKSFNYDEPVINVPPANIQSQFGDQSGLEALLAQNSGAAGGQPAPYSLQLQLQQRQAQRNQYGHHNADTFTGYPNDLDYTMCVRKESGFCSITYQLSRTESGFVQPFSVGYPLLGQNDTLFGVGGGGLSTANSAQWLPVSTECRDDYLLIGGVRLCSGASQSPQQLSSSFVDYQQGANAAANNLGAAASIQFAQNGSILSSTGVNQQATSQMYQIQHLEQTRRNILARLHQLTNGGSFSNNNGTGSGGANLDQQREALQQQYSFVSQQLAILALGGDAVSSQLTGRFGGGYQTANSNNNYIGSNNNNYNANNNFWNSQNGAIITDTTSGPFLLRFVSNMSRNARGFQIDYRQNPCK